MHFIIGFAILFLLFAFFPRLFLQVLGVGVGIIVIPLAVIACWGAIEHGLITFGTLLIVLIILYLCGSAISNVMKQDQQENEAPKLHSSKPSRIEPHF